MNTHAHASREDLVEALLAPISAEDRTGQSLLVTRLAIARELLLRDLAQKLATGPSMDSPQVVREWLSLYFIGAEREIFLVMYLDNRHRLIDSQALFQGTVHGTAVYPREVVREALGRNAAAIIVAHNHPSGSANASDADRMVTTRLKEALALVEIRLLDHFVVGGRDIVSLAEEGAL